MASTLGGNSPSLALDTRRRLTPAMRPQQLRHTRAAVPSVVLAAVTATGGDTDA
jgi:hypothetical protein